MSVTAQTPFKQYTAAPGATVFSTDFRIILATDLQVLVNGAIITSGFTLAGVNAPTGCDVTFTAPMIGGEVVILQRRVPLARTTDYQQLGQFKADVVNRDVDRLWMALQDAGFQNALTVSLPAADTAAPMVLPTVAERAGFFLAFDGAGRAIPAAGGAGVPVTPFITGLMDDVDAAAARATLGAMAANSSNVAAGATGTANAITATIIAAVTLTNGLTVLIRAASANTVAAPTLALNGLAAKAIVKGGNRTLAAGDIAGAGHWLLLTYDAALDKWVLQNPSIGTGLPGEVIQKTLYPVDAGSSTNSGSLANTSGSAKAFTPRSTNSIIKVTCYFQGVATLLAANNTVATFSLYESGSPIGDTYTLGVANGAGGNRGESPCVLTARLTNSALTTRSFSLAAAISNISAQASGLKQYFEIEEIQQ